MAKLYFRYGPMGCGKSLQLLSVAYNFEDRSHRVAVLKPALDTKGSTRIVARADLSREADYLLSADDQPLEIITDLYRDVSCVLVDEAQFLSRSQIDQLAEITIDLDIPVIAYGLRTNRFGETWEGSARLLAIADDLEEIKTICSCGRKATMTIAFMDGVLETSGDENLIDDGTTNIKYEAICRTCLAFLKRTS